MIPQKGDRITMTGVMPDDPYPMEIGDEGTVESIGAEFGGITQINVQWDNKRNLILLDTDPFVVTGRQTLYCRGCGVPHPPDGPCLRKKTNVQDCSMERPAVSSPDASCADCAAGHHPD